ncbi:hypothetical protein KP509_23G016100 [Ceratopteris richardii]|nr:hypothetical protein KP509_23G016100 [Ceratopteris richardii]
MVTFPELPSLPGWALPWTIGDEVINEHAFKLISESMTACSESDWILGNFIRELEASALSEIPPHFKHPTMVGPILPVNVLQRTSTSENMLTMSLWVEEDTCLHWLNAQKPKSVLYVSLGSVATVKKDQLQELALGLEAAGLATLWVVREDLTGEKGTSLPEGFLQRTQERIRIVSWSPQLLVLSHGAVGGFLTHCGWNSIIEALSMGVPLLAWPQLGDQYMNAEVSVTKWGAGLKLNDFEKKLVRREHVAIQVKKLMLEHAGEVARSRAEEIRDQILKAVGEGGSSYNNLQGFVRWVKHQAGPTINIGSLLSA